MTYDHHPTMLSLLQQVETGDTKTDRDLRLLCSADWSSTSLGPLSSWPQDLLTLVYLAMLSPLPQFFFLGTDHIFLYNTAASLLLRNHHPAYFAKPVATLERLQPQAEAISQIIKDATESRRPAMQRDLPFFFDNDNGLEELILSTTMVLLPPHLPGYQATVEDTTFPVITKRRNQFLTRLKSRCASANNLSLLIQTTLQNLSSNEDDFPFGVLYQVADQTVKGGPYDSPQRDESSVTLHVAGSVGDFDCHLPESVDLGKENGILAQQMRKAITSREPVKINIQNDKDLAYWSRASKSRGYKDSCKEAIIFPASGTAFQNVKALVIVGIAPRRPFDEVYQGFIRNVQKCIADQAFAISCMEAKEFEKRKASERAREDTEIHMRELEIRKKEIMIANGKLEGVVNISDTIDVGFFDFLPTGELIHGNNAYHELTGYPKDPSLNKEYSFLNYCFEDDVELVKDRWGVLMGGTSTTFEMRWKNNTPTGQWVQAACAPIFDDAGNVVSISGCTTDISGQKRAQEDALKRAEALEQVRISQARLLQFTDNAPIGIVILEASGQPSYINRSWYNITDHPEVSPSEVDIMSVCFPDDIPKIKRKQGEAISGRKTVEFRTRLKKKWTCVDGSFQGQAWVSIMYLPEFDDDGVLSRVMSTCTDISHSQFSEHLQRKRLEEAIEAKRRTEAFIDTVSHEIRNPLSATVHCADLLQDAFVEMRKLVDKLAESGNSDKTRQNTTAQLEEHLEGGIDAVETILSCSMHQKRMTDDILSLSKLDSNLLQVSPSTVRATEMLDNVSNFFAVEAGREGIKLQTQMDDSLEDCNVEWVVVDPGRITQVLVNLVTNALKFTRTSKNERNVTVRLGASKGPPSNLSVKYAAVENPETIVQTDVGIETMIYLWFSVTDSGCGMTEDEQMRMFNRFSQASPKTYNQYGGSGLGLHISKRLVELQGGQIGLASQVDIGSRFAFYIPARQTTKSMNFSKPELLIRRKIEGPPSDPTGTKTASNGQISADYPISALPPPKVLQQQIPPPDLSYHILLVEDNLINQKVLQKQLTKHGYRVQTANHGQEALDYLSTTTIWKQQDRLGTTPSSDVHVILMDIEMPIMDGLTCSKRIRELQGSGDILRHIPIIAVSANARAEQTKLALDAGMDDFITKPFRMPELTSVISKLLETA